MGVAPKICFELHLHPFNRHLFDKFGVYSLYNNSDLRVRTNRKCTILSNPMKRPKEFILLINIKLLSSKLLFFYFSRVLKYFLSIFLVFFWYFPSIFIESI